MKPKPNFSTQSFILGETTTLKMPKPKTAGKLTEIELLWWREPDRPSRFAPPVNTARVSCRCTQITPAALEAIDAWIQVEAIKPGAFLSVGLQLVEDHIEGSRLQGSAKRWTIEGSRLQGSAKRWTIEGSTTFNATKEMGLVLRPGGILDVKAG